MRKISYKAILISPLLIFIYSTFSSLFHQSSVMMRILFPVFAALVGTKFDLFPIGRELVVVGMVIGLQSLCFMMEMALLVA